MADKRLKRATSQKPSVSIIIPTFKRNEKLINCLKSMEKSKYKNYEIIVINDDPSQDLKPLLKGFNIRLVQHKEEKYWVMCRNEGAILAKGKLLFFIDDDNILTPECLGLMVKKYQALKKVGLLGPIMYDASGNLWFYGAKANWISPYPKKVKKTQLNQELIETDVVPNSYMIEKDLFIRVGMEDPNLLYHEELDLAQRLKKEGYKNYIYTKAKIIHDYGSAKSRITPLRVYATIKSHFMIEKKYAPLPKLILFLLVFIPINTIYYLCYKIPTSDYKEKFQIYKAYFKGLVEGIEYLLLKNKQSMNQKS